MGCQAPIKSHPLRSNLALGKGLRVVSISYRPHYTPACNGTVQGSPNGFSPSALGKMLPFSPSSMPALARDPIGLAPLTVRFLTRSVPPAHKCARGWRRITRQK